MPGTCGSMKSTGSLVLALLGLAAAGCAPYADGNPMAASAAPTPVACPARFNFEPPQSLSGWWAPSWPGGFMGMRLDSDEAHCGLQSMRVSMDLSGPQNRMAQIQYFFPSAQAVTAATRSAWVFFKQAPPAGLRLQMVFVDATLNWAPGTTAKSGFGPGWTQVSAVVTAPSVQGLLLLWDAPGTAYQGDVWIDEINW